jgi:transposase InsO family protein
MTDLFTKYVEVIPVPDQTAEECARRLLNDFVARWGCPLSILSDQGRNYESRIIKEMCRMLSIKKTRTSARNPKCNGQAERFNGSLIKMVKAFICGQEEWDLNLGCMAGAYRATPHDTTTLSPNLMTIGREICLPAELVYSCQADRQTNPVTSYGQYVDRLRATMQKAHEVARTHMGKNAVRSKEIYDINVHLYKYNLGDIVWCLAESRKVGVARKLERNYSGPYVIIKVLSPVTFVLQVDRNGKDRVIHHDKLKPYEGDEPPDWAVRLKRRLDNH